MHVYCTCCGGQIRADQRFSVLVSASLINLHTLLACDRKRACIRNTFTAAKHMHHHVVTHPHDATVCVKKISELAVIMIKHQDALGTSISAREAAHRIFDKRLDLEPLILESEVRVEMLEKQD